MFKTIMIIVLLILWIHSTYKIGKFIQAIQVMKGTIKALADKAGLDGEKLIHEMGLK